METQCSQPHALCTLGKPHVGCMRVLWEQQHMEDGDVCVHACVDTPVYTEQAAHTTDTCEHTGQAEHTLHTQSRLNTHVHTLHRHTPVHTPTWVRVPPPSVPGALDWGWVSPSLRLFWSPSAQGEPSPCPPTALASSPSVGGQGQRQSCDLSDTQHIQDLTTWTPRSQKNHTGHRHGPRALAPPTL